MPEKSQKIFIINSTVSGDILQFIGEKQEINIKIEPKLQLGDYSDFVGRKDELNWLRGRFENGNTRRAILTGGAGIGKTFLAGVFASKVSFPNGYLTVFVGDRKVEEVSFQILRYFDYKGEEPKSPNKAKDLLQQYLANTFDGLLVLDNVESPSANYLIPGGKVKTLITTRDKSIALELANPTNIKSLKEFTPDQCLDLFDKYTNNSDSASLLTLSDFLGHLPYAIRLSAKLLHEFPIIMPTDLIQQYGRNSYTIQERIDLLLEKSYSMLSVDEKTLLLCLGNCSSKGIHFHLFRSIFNFDEDYCQNNLYKPNKLSLLEITNESVLKFHPLTKIFLRNKDVINKNRCLVRYLKGLHKLTDTKRISYYTINEFRSCFQNIHEDVIDRYFNILDDIILKIDDTRHVVADIVTLLIDKCSKMELPIERYINYYFENAKQFKKAGNYDEASKYINVVIDYYKE